MTWLVLVPLGLLALVALDRLLLWMESRGWIFYRRRKPKGAGAAALGVAAELFQPTQYSAVLELDERSRRVDATGEAAPLDRQGTDAVNSETDESPSPGAS